MSGVGKRSFTSFVRPTAPAQPTQTPTELAQPDTSPPARLTGAAHEFEPREGKGSDADERTRVVTSTGRVRTYTASRNLPGVTLRMSESRWERLKLLSIQERRPIQEILGEAMADFMRARGLPW
jgi:hypothetical protein